MSNPSKPDAAQPSESPESKPEKPVMPKEIAPREIGGPKGLEPTRYGDWERNGRVSDF